MWSRSKAFTNLVDVTQKGLCSPLASSKEELPTHPVASNQGLRMRMEKENLTAYFRLHVTRDALPGYLLEATEKTKAFIHFLL